MKTKETKEMKNSNFIGELDMELEALDMLERPNTGSKKVFEESTVIVFLTINCC